MINAQTGDVTIKARVHEVKYCLGPTSYFPAKQQPAASDITLRLVLDLLYENHGSEPIIVPLGYRSVARMVLAGQGDAQAILSRVVPFPQQLTPPGQPDRSKPMSELARPEPPYFIVIPGGKSEWRYLGEPIDVRVRSSDRQLLGKIFQFSVTRDHGLLTFEKLQDKWKSYGTFWTGIQESDTASVPIPESPETSDCRKDERF